MIEINRNQILEIIIHESRIDVSTADRPEGFIPGKKHLEIIFMDEPTAHNRVFFKGVEFLVQSASQPVPGQINWTYSAVSTGDCSPLGELLKMARLANTDGDLRIKDGQLQTYFKMSNQNVFDTKTEIGLLKARIEALETALQRVPYAGYDKDMVITEATVGRSNGLTYPIYGDSYTGDGVLIIKSVSDIKWKEGFCCDIVFKHQNVNLKRVVYSDVLFEVTDGKCNENDELCTYEAASISPMSEQLFYEAKERINKI